VATNGGNDAGIRERVSTLEQLLDVYERSVLEQSDKLYAEQERLRLQTTLLASQGEASLDGILSESIDGRILFCNNRLAEMWGVESRGLEADGCALAFQEMADRSADPSRFLERVASIRDDEETRDDVVLADGRTFERYTAPICRADGVILGRVWHFRDITEVKRMGWLKDEFISAVSHELRTPLTSIRGSLDLIASGVMGEVSSEAMALAKIAQANCERLTRLINDVLDIEKIESGTVELQLTPLALEPLVAQSVEAIHPYGRELGVDFVIESSVAGARVRGCADRLIQVMENLLSNAAKFSPRGATVRVTLTRHGERLRVCVADQGLGIAPEFHSRIFEKFAQIPSRAGTVRKEGTGLGLNIARATVEHHGGTIGFSSKPGAGSCFYFELPEEQLETDGKEST
jgi:signal transduction histidine kinase